MSAPCIRASMQMALSLAFGSKSEETSRAFSLAKSNLTLQDTLAVHRVIGAENHADNSFTKILIVLKRKVPEHVVLADNFEECGGMVLFERRLIVIDMREWVPAVADVEVVESRMIDIVCSSRQQHDRIVKRRELAHLLEIAALYKEVHGVRDIKGMGDVVIWVLIMVAVRHGFSDLAELLRVELELRK